MLKDVEYIKYSKQSGVYLLIGTDDNENSVVYVGQASNRKNGEGLLCRLKEHDRNEEKGYWTEAVIFTTKNNNLGQTEISYLENRFCEIIGEANRYDLKNDKTPNSGNVTEEEKSDLEEFIEYSRLIMGALGYTVFEPIIKKKTEEKPSNINEEPVLYIKSSTLKATGKEVVGGFVVMKESKISSEIKSSCAKNVINLRNKYTENKTIDNNYKINKDILFTSPSAAAKFVLGYSSNGYEAWVNDKGKTLKELKNN